VVASQVALHHHLPQATRLKAALQLPELLSQATDALAPALDLRRPRLSALLGGAARLLHGGCPEPLCQQLTLLYGRLYEHGALDEATHARLHQQFGPCSVLALRHLAQLGRAGRSQRFDLGRARNMRRYGRAEPPDDLDPRHLRLPITLVSGEHNGTYLPSSTEATYRWLREAHGPALYRRHVLAGYGHLDTFLGAHAARDTYPLLRQALEATA
jgi:hypothetical protein